MTGIASDLFLVHVLSRAPTLNLVTSAQQEPAALLGIVSQGVGDHLRDHGARDLYRQTVGSLSGSGGDSP